MDNHEDTPLHPAHSNPSADHHDMMKEMVSRRASKVKRRNSNVSHRGMSPFMEEYTKKLPEIKAIVDRNRKRKQWKEGNVRTSVCNLAFPASQLPGYLTYPRGIGGLSLKLNPEILEEYEQDLEDRKYILDLYRDSILPCKAKFRGSEEYEAVKKKLPASRRPSSIPVWYYKRVPPNNGPHGHNIMALPSIIAPTLPPPPDTHPEEKK